MLFRSENENGSLKTIRFPTSFLVDELQELQKRKKGTPVPPSQQILAEQQKAVQQFLNTIAGLKNENPDVVEKFLTKITIGSQSYKGNTGKAKQNFERLKQHVAKVKEGNTKRPKGVLPQPKKIAPSGESSTDPNKVNPTTLGSIVENKIQKDKNNIRKLLSRLENTKYKFGAIKKRILPNGREIYRYIAPGVIQNQKNIKKRKY